MKLILTMVTAALASTLFASSTSILFYGYVVEGNVDTMFQKRVKSKPLEGVTVYITDDEGNVSEIENRESGFYNIVLEPGRKYTVKFVKEGFIAKMFEIDGNGVPEDQDEESFKMFTDVTLFPSKNYPQEHTLSSAPVAKCKYDAQTKRLEWDMDHAKIAFDHFLRVTGQSGRYADK